MKQTFSYWEKKTFFEEVDLVIVGSGIVGLFTAIEIRRLHPKMKIVLLERGLLPNGASTKNAGFSCFGSLSELLDDLNNFSLEESIALVKLRIDGLKKLRLTLGDDNIEFNSCGGFELFTHQEEDIFNNCLNNMNNYNQLLNEIVGKNTYSIVDSLSNNFSFSPLVKGIIKNQYEGSINTGKMYFNLNKLAINNEIIILNNFELKSYQKSGNGIEIFGDWINFKTQKLVFTTNGFTQHFFPKMDIQPARAQVLVTNQIHGLQLNGTFHHHKGYNYFRNIDGRILLGGGRHLNLEGEKSDEMELTNEIQNYLENLLKEIILPKQEFKIEYRWSGVMGVGNIKKPIIEKVDENIFVAVRMGGMGVAIGSKIGEMAAEMISNDF